MKRLKSILFAGLSALVFVATVAPAAPVAAQSSAALSIVPKKNYVIEAGKTIKDTLTIRNLDSQRDLELTLRMVDFTYSDDGGTPKLMLAEDAPQTTWSLKPFLKMPTSVTVAPGSSETVDMTISIPANQGAGSYYSAILYSSGSPDGGNVGLSASGVTLAFASVPGEVNENLQLEKFGAYKAPAVGSGGSYMFMTTGMPKTMGYTLKNNGNVTESPIGTITLKNMFGKEYTIDNVNPNQSLALIGQSRTFTACIQPKEENVEFNGGTTQSTACVDPGLWPGYYSASIDLFYGQNGNNTQEINSKGSFWYLPWWFVAVVVVVVLAITFGVWKLVRKIKGRKYDTQRKKLSRRIK